MSGGIVSGGKRGELWGRSKGNSFKGGGRSKCEGHFVKALTHPLTKCHPAKLHSFLPVGRPGNKHSLVPSC